VQPDTKSSRFNKAHHRRGFESGYDPEFVQFLKMARRSAGEVQSELYLALDAEFIATEELKKAYDLAVKQKS
jgi:four helix bundle protein